MGVGLLVTLLVARACRERGVRVAWFGGREVAGFTSTHHHWRWAGSGCGSSGDPL